MSATESFDDLEHKVARLVEDALTEVRQEFLNRLQDVRERLDQLVGREVATAKEEALAAAEAATVEAEKAAAEAAALAPPPAAAGDDVLRSLLRAVGDIDTARSQSEVLRALLDGSAGFADRALLFLTREDGLQGWGGNGFPTSSEQLRELHVDYYPNSAWSRVAGGHGAVELGAEDCDELCRQLDAERPMAGVLIPLVLRDRLAAALYADSSDPQTPLPVTALQLLTYIAAQTLETLPLRQRSSTATLRLASEAPEGEPSLELWPFVVPPPQPLEEPATVRAEPEEVAFEEVGAGAEPEATVEAPETAPESIEVEDRWQEPPHLQPAEETGFAVEEIAQPMAPAEELAAPEAFVEEPSVLEPEPAWEPPPTVEEPAPEEAVEPEPAWEPPPSVEEPAPEEAAEPEPAWEPPPSVEEPAPEEAAEPAPEMPPPAPPTEVTPPVAGTVSEARVAPPEDVEGPGWAFTTRRFSSDMGEESAHEEARRLARLLVTEIKLYNEEQVEEGRRHRNIYQSLREDIDRSRQIYEERIDQAVRAETDYFREELIRILAAGDADILGI